MSSVETRRYELKTTILKEDERRETLKISKFNKVISEVEAELSVKNKKIESLQERAKTSSGVESLRERLAGLSDCVRSLKNLSKEKRVVSDKLSNLNKEKAAQVEVVLGLKSKGEKIAEVIAERKAMAKHIKEVSAQEEIVSTKTSAEITSRESRDRVKGELGDTFSINQSDILQGAINQGPDKVIDAAVISGLNGANSNGSFAGTSSNSERGGDQGRFNTQGESRDTQRSWSELKGEVRGVETQNFEGGKGVALALTGQSGEELKVRVQRKGQKLVRVEIETNHAADQRRAWAKKAEISTALQAAGFSVEAVIVGGKK